MAKKGKATGSAPKSGGRNSGSAEKGGGGFGGGGNALGRSLDAPIHEATGTYGREAEGVLGRMVRHFDSGLDRGKRR